MILKYNIENGEILFQGKGHYYSKLKEQKLNTKKMLKSAILGEQDSSVH